MIRRPPRSTQSRSSAASDVYKRQLLQYMFVDSPVPPTGPIFDTIGPRIMGLFPLILMFLITSITMLRERQSGTLERLMVGPTGKAEMILGYALAFGLVASMQAIVMT